MADLVGMAMTLDLDAQSAGYVDAVAARLAAILGRRLVGVWLHGSAVLGGFARARSDIDLLAVTTTGLTKAANRHIAAALSPPALPCPAVGLELSVVTRASALAPVPAPPFELHLATGPGPHARVVDGRDHPGDPDLLLHFAVCGDHGHRIGTGPPTTTVFAPIPRPWLLDGLERELQWAKRHATWEYQVLNACRAWRFAEQGVWCSKLDGGRWAADRVEDPAVVELAIARQQAGPAAELPAPDPGTVNALLQQTLQRLRHART
jgi:streptomycin 3"-adenylyltransferase